MLDHLMLDKVGLARKTKEHSDCMHRESRAIPVSSKGSSCTYFWLELLRSTLNSPRGLPVSQEANAASPGPREFGYMDKTLMKNLDFVTAVPNNFYSFDDLLNCYSLVRSWSAHAAITPYYILVWLNISWTVVNLIHYIHRKSLNLAVRLG